MIQKKDKVAGSKVVYANDIFTKDMLNNVTSIYGSRGSTLVKDKEVIKSVFSRFSCRTLTPAEEPKETLYGHHTFRFTMKDGTEYTFYVQDNILIYNNQRYTAQGLDGVEIFKVLSKFGTVK